MKDQKTEVVEANVVETQPTDLVPAQETSITNDVANFDLTECEEDGSNIGLIIGLGAGISLAAYGVVQLVKNVRNRVQEKKANHEFIKEALDAEFEDDETEPEDDEDSKKKSKK